MAYGHLPAPIAGYLRTCHHKRATQPVWHEDTTATWHIYRYSDVVRVLIDARNFGAARFSGSQFSAFSAFAQPPPLLAHRHVVVYTLLREVLTPRVVVQLQPYVERTAGALLDPVRSAGKLEVMSDLARPLATSVLAELLGVPVADRGRLEVSRAYFARLAAAFDPPGHHAGPGSHQAPDQTLVSKLLSVEVEGERLTHDEGAAACYFFMTAARRALSDMVGNTLLTLSLHPDVLKRLRRDPAPFYSTVEEALRYLPPVWTAHRTVIAPLALGGQHLPPGAHVCAWIVSANHDPEPFAQPDHFDIDRIPNRHLSFGGAGTFACLGAGLARLVTRLTLAAIAQRVSGFELAPGDAIAVASPGAPEDVLDQPESGEQQPAGNRLPDRCSLAKLAIVFEAGD